MSDMQLPIGSMQAMLEPGGTAGLLRHGKAGRGAIPHDKAEKIAKDFESVLLHKLMEQMQRTVGDSGLLSSGISEQVKGIFWFYLAQEVADSGGIGLWKDIYQQITSFGQAPQEAPTVEQNV